MNQSIVLQLLDSAQERPLQSWTFSNTQSITIGRAEGNDVVLADPFVSRAHARVELVAGGWRLVSLSEQQVVCDGQRRQELDLSDGTVFQLGPRGCAMRFGAARPTSSGQSTLAFDPATMPIFKLDAQQLDREVAEVSSSAYFQELRQASERLRQRREEEAR